MARWDDPRRNICGVKISFTAQFHLELPVVTRVFSADDKSPGSCDVISQFTPFPDEQRVMLDFGVFGLHCSSVSTGENKLTLHDGETESSPVLTKLCKAGKWRRSSFGFTFSSCKGISTLAFFFLGCFSSLEQNSILVRIYSVLHFVATSLSSCSLPEIHQLVLVVVALSKLFALLL